MSSESAAQGGKVDVDQIETEPAKSICVDQTDISLVLFFLSFFFQRVFFPQPKKVYFFVYFQKPQLFTLNINKYASTKTLAQGMLDLALLSANAAQLKFLLANGNNHSFHMLLMCLVISSIGFQVNIETVKINNHNCALKIPLFHTGSTSMCLYHFGFDTGHKQCEWSKTCPHREQCVIGYSRGCRHTECYYQRFWY